jgi:hypothetical protein
MEKKTALYIKLKKSEKVQIEVRAKMEGKTVSEYLRKTALR